MIDECEQPDDFDRFTRARLHVRGELLESVAHLRPDDGDGLKRAGHVHGDFHELNPRWDPGDKSRTQRVPGRASGHGRSQGVRSVTIRCARAGSGALISAAKSRKSWWPGSFCRHR